MASLIVPDFSKIFAQNASSIQNWSDADYNTGWGFLGQEPPPYELFDELFRKNDQKSKYLFDDLTDVKTRLGVTESGIQTLNSNLNTVNANYLSKLTGGTVSGSTTFSNYLSMSKTLSTTDKSLYVPNTTWVHNLINYFLTTANTTQNNAFKTAVQNAIAAGYHGITQDFSNPNAWWCKFPNGLIIQGGWNIIPERQVKTIPFPINFTNKAFKPLIAWDDPAQGANPSWQFVAGATADTTSLQIGLHTQNGEGERGVNWLVAGI